MATRRTRSSCSARTRSRRTGSTSWPDLPGDPLPPLNPATRQPAGPDDLAPIFPMALIEQEVSRRAGDRDSRRRARGLPALAPDAALPRAAPGARARYARADLLQVRGRLARPARTSPTPPCRRPTTTRRPASASWPRRPARGSGARRWPSPARSSGWSARSTWCGSSYDQKPYRRSMMETWGATCTARPATEPSRAAPFADHPTRLPGHRDLRGRRGRGQGPGHQLRAGQRAQPRAAAPDRHRPGGDRADGAGRRRARRRHRLRRRRLELRRPGASRTCGRKLRDGNERAHRRGRAGGLPQPDQGRLRLRLRRHRRASRR